MMAEVETNFADIQKAVQEGQADGIEQSIAVLIDAMPHVDPENRTWDAAIAMLRIFESKVRSAAE